jgi:predicted nucleotidyltransferase
MIWVMEIKLNSQQFGLKSEVFTQIRRIFSQFKEIDTVILYGSRAKGTYHNGSDIDLNLKGYALTDRVIGKLEEELDNLLLPYTFDVSSWDQIDNPDLRAHIERVGVVIYERR